MDAGSDTVLSYLYNYCFYVACEITVSYILILFALLPEKKQTFINSREIIMNIEY